MIVGSRYGDTIPQNNSAKSLVVYQFVMITIIKYMLKSYCYRIYPTNVQQQILRMQLGAVRIRS